MRFAAAEAIAIFGLPASCLGARAGHVAALFAASIVGFLFAHPSRQAFSEALRPAEAGESRRLRVEGRELSKGMSWDLF